MSPWSARMPHCMNREVWERERVETDGQPAGAGGGGLLSRESVEGKLAWCSVTRPLYMLYNRLYVTFWQHHVKERPWLPLSMHLPFLLHVCVNYMKSGDKTVRSLYKQKLRILNIYIYIYIYIFITIKVKQITLLIPEWINAVIFGSRAFNFGSRPISLA